MGFEWCGVGGKVALRGRAAGYSLLLVVCCGQAAAAPRTGSSTDEAQPYAPVSSPALLPAPESGLEPAQDLAIDNARAGEFHRVGRLRDFGLSGRNILVGVYESGGGPVTTHEAFGGRVRQADTGIALSRHATHVAGTIASNSTSNPAAKGMAPDAQVEAYDVKEREYDEMRDADPAMAVSNHSYGRTSGWEFHEVAADVCGVATGTAPINVRRPCWSWQGEELGFEDPTLGQYTSEARQFDFIAWEKPYRTFVVSAGNHRAVPDPLQWDGWYVMGEDVTWRWMNTQRRADSTDDAFDTLTGGRAVAKNVITVGSIDDVDGALIPGRVRVSDFSSFGPTDDGRIKPDVVANGNLLYSPTYAKLANGQPDPAAYELMPGTSMATPVVTGIVALLDELSQKEGKDLLTADEAKALLIHTAVNRTAGPNYRTGWGAVDGLAAGTILRGGPGVPTLVRGVTGDPAAKTELAVQRGQKIKVTLVWTDWGGDVRNRLDDDAPTLVDDLDLEVTDPAGNRYYPWSLDPKSPAKTATRCIAEAGRPDTCRPNRLDNVEQVQVDRAPRGGKWKIRVLAPKTALRRRYALVVGEFQKPIPNPPAESPGQARR